MNIYILPWVKIGLFLVVLAMPLLPRIALAAKGDAYSCSSDIVLVVNEEKGLKKYKQVNFDFNWNATSVTFSKVAVFTAKKKTWKLSFQNKTFFTARDSFGDIQFNEKNGTLLLYFTRMSAAYFIRAKCNLF